MRSGRISGPQKGRLEGIAEGRREGLAKALRLMAEQRFGAGTGARLAELLAPVDDADWLDEMTQWIMACQTGDELIERVSRAGNRPAECRATPGTDP